jgi:hypothetical protein
LTQASINENKDENVPCAIQIVCETTAIYTYRLLDDYRAKKLEIIPEVVRLKDVEVVPEYLVLLKCTESA